MNIDRVRTATAAIILSLSGLLSEVANATTLDTPYGLAVNPYSGRVYIADPGAGKVHVYDPDSHAITQFVLQSDPFSVAVNSDSLVYVGVVGANSQIKVFDTQGRQINGYRIPAGDSPITMAFDSDNILYQARGRIGDAGVPMINAFTNDLSYPYTADLIHEPDGPPDASYRLPTYTSLPPGSRYALAYDHGQIFILGGRPGATVYNVVDTPVLLSGRALILWTRVTVSSESDKWMNVHTIRMIGAASAATVDSNHLIFYTDPDSKTVVVTGKTTTPRTLLSNLPSAPYGIAFDRKRSRLYVSFPGEHLIRIYAVTYTIQNGVKIPALSAPLRIR
jgi:DNA-binding beta-propeller fold protein YncE